MLGVGAYGTDYEGTSVGVKKQLAEFKKQGINAEFLKISMIVCLFHK